MTTEIWKDVYFNGVITSRVSNTGFITNTKGEHRKLTDNGAGYFSVQVATYRSDSGKTKSKRDYIHRLVAKHFLDNPDNLPQVNHKDCNKSNNHVDNLEWISGSDNIKHAHEEGRMIKRSTDASIVILTKEQVIDCYTRVKSGEGVAEVARSMCKPRTTISSIMNKRSRKDITDMIDATITTS
jgi:hypothetical protein